MAEKLSVLIFSRNDVEKALDLIRDIYDIADEIVIVDSSTDIGHSRLLKARREFNFKKLRIFYIIALGYADPLRMYAIGKCNGKWVLMLDTDERISSEFKSTIH